MMCYSTPLPFKIIEEVTTPFRDCFKWAILYFNTEKRNYLRTTIHLKEYTTFVFIMQIFIISSILHIIIRTLIAVSCIVPKYNVALWATYTLLSSILEIK